MAGQTEHECGVQTGVQLHLSFFPLSFFLFFCTPQVEIDGLVQQRPWGAHFFALSPGPHRVRIWFPYMGMPQCGISGVDFTVAPNEVIRINYSMPPWMFAQGSIEIAGRPMASVAPAAGWFTDPTGRHQVRYWDGARWTEAVSDNGVQSTDVA